MRKEHIKYLVCPGCKGDLVIDAIHDGDELSVKSGILRCSQCCEKFPVVRCVPRFKGEDDYVGNFGLQWTAHQKITLDSFNRTNISQKKFFEETKWPDDLTGQIILEVGCGAGRFTEIAISTGAFVVSMDYSDAVDANYASNGKSDHVLIVRADIYKMPFKENFFDKLFCLGVLQHTPDVERSFFTLPKYLKSGGRLAIDLYRKPVGIEKLVLNKYYLRQITTRISPQLLYQLCKMYINFVWPLVRIINKVLPYPYNFYLNLMIFVAIEPVSIGLPDKELKEIALLITYDMFSAKYDFPQTLDTIKGWFQASGMKNIDVCKGHNGIEGRGIKL